METECEFSYAPAHKSDGSDHFRVDGSDVTITGCRACAEEFANVGAKIAPLQIPNTEDTVYIYYTTRTPTAETVWGIYIWPLTLISIGWVLDIYSLQALCGALCAVSEGKPPRHASHTSHFKKPLE